MPLFLVLSHNKGKWVSFPTPVGSSHTKPLTPLYTEKETEGPSGVGDRAGVSYRILQGRFPPGLRPVTGPYSQCPCPREGWGTERMASRQARDMGSWEAFNPEAYV